MILFLTSKIFEITKTTLLIYGNQSKRKKGEVRRFFPFSSVVFLEEMKELGTCISQTENTWRSFPGFYSNWLAKLQTADLSRLIQSKKDMLRGWFCNWPPCMNLTSYTIYIQFYFIFLMLFMKKSKLGNFLRDILLNFLHW